MNDLEKEAGLFGSSLAIFAHRRKLPRSMFNYPDHVVLQASDIQDFSRLNQEEVAPESTEMFCIETMIPFRTAARLKGKVALYELGFIDWVSVEEPKRQPVTPPGLARAEFYSDSLEGSLDALKSRGIRSRIIAEKNRAYVPVMFQEDGSEFRLTDTSLEDVTIQRLDDEEAVVIKIPPWETNITVL